MSKVQPKIDLSREVLELIYRHAIEDYPNECCGIVFASVTQSQYCEVFRSKNIQNDCRDKDPLHNNDATQAFTMHPAHVQTLKNSLDTERPAVLVYHSHIDSSANFSSQDQRSARSGNEPLFEVDHLVVSVMDRAAVCAIQYGWSNRHKRYIEVARYPRHQAEYLE